MENIKNLFTVNGVLFMGILTYVVAQLKSIWKIGYDLISKKYMMNLVVTGSGDGEILIKELINITNDDKIKTMIKNNTLMVYGSENLVFGDYLVRITPTVWGKLKTWKEQDTSLGGRLNSSDLYTGISLYGIGRQDVYNKLKTSVDRKTYEDVYVFADGDNLLDTSKKIKYSDKVLFGKDVKKVTEFLTKWDKTEHVYRTFGRKRKLAFLLHGEPGTGKTSLVYKIADIVGSNRICSLNAILKAHPSATVYRLNDIDNLFFNFKDSIKGKYDIVVIEELDKLINENTKDGQVKSNYMESIIMQLLDGLNTPDNTIIIMTTNNRTDLTNSLTRAGRVDFEIEIGKIARLDAEEMCKYYNVPVSILGDENEFNPAELENMIFKYKIDEV